jgi:hypothetical protein
VALANERRCQTTRMEKEDVLFGIQACRNDVPDFQKYFNSKP